MRAVLHYFRQHPWQRRAITLSLAAISGVGAAWLVWPVLRDRQILGLLGSPDATQRHRGILWAQRVAPKRPELLRLLEGKLDEADDRQFAAIAEVLIQAGRFKAPYRTDEQLDRYAVVNLALAKGKGPETVHRRLLWLGQLILSGRDNAHVRRALALAADDVSPEVRQSAAVLAAKLGDERTLSALLGDGQAAVRAEAALAAALAGQSRHVPAIAAIFDRHRSGPLMCAAAYALAQLAPRAHGRRIVDRIKELLPTGSAAEVDQLLCAAGLLERDLIVEAARAALACPTGSGGTNRIPSAMAFVLAGRAGLADAKPRIAAVVDGMIARKEELTMGEAVTLAATVDAARRLGMPASFFRKVLRELWHPGTSLAMIFAAEALGRSSAAAGHDETLALLRAAADDSRAPVPAAAAAVALYRLAPDSPQTLEALRAVCSSETYLAGDYLAWHLSRVPLPGAERVALAFFGPNEYDRAVRSVGAVLLALLARRTGRAGEVCRLIEARLRGGLYGPERDPFVAGSYCCALVILGRRDFARDIRTLSYSDTFPKRRALTALLLAGDPEGFDRVLAAVEFDPAEADSYLTGRLMARVYAAVAPELPPFYLAGPAAVRYWQCRVLRDYYLIHRSSLLNRQRRLAGK